MNEIEKVIDTLDDAVEKFDGVVDKAQTKMYKELVALIKDLELDSAGKVKQTIANLKVLTSIKSKLGKIANSDEWVAGVENLIRYFGKLQNEQNAYFSANFPEATLGDQAKKRHEVMKQIAVQNTVNALTDDGLKAGVTDKINDILLRAVTSGEKFGNLQEELRAYLVGKDGGTGALSRYATTYATTSISQFTGQNNKLMTQDLGVEWFMYTGSTKETTREFCTHLVEKRYVHRSEFRKILLGEIDGHKCAIYPKTGLPYGMIEGTNEDNFQINCGGWNCRHQLVPVSEFAVPQNIRDKFKKITTSNIDAGDTDAEFFIDKKTEYPEFQRTNLVTPRRMTDNELRKRAGMIEKRINTEERRLFTSDIVEYCKNSAIVENFCGKKKGEPMSFEKADGGSVNPNFVDYKTSIDAFGNWKEYNFETGAYFINNCQSCVLAYELRRRGFDVQAFGTSFAPGTKAYSLASNSTFSCFINRSTGKPYTVAEAESAQLDNPEDFVKIARTRMSVGRYCLRFFSGRTNHVVVVENGVVYDPQSGNKTDVKDFSMNVNSIHFLRIDDKLINEECINGIVF